MTGHVAQIELTRPQDHGREVLASVAFCAGALFDEWNKR